MHNRVHGYNAKHSQNLFMDMQLLDLNSVSCVGLNVGKAAQIIQDTQNLSQFLKEAKVKVK